MNNILRYLFVFWPMALVIITAGYYSVRTGGCISANFSASWCRYDNSHPIEAANDILLSAFAALFGMGWIATMRWALTQPMKIPRMCKCQHSINWHGDNGSCQFPKCDCLEFKDK